MWSKQRFVAAALLCMSLVGAAVAVDDPIAKRRAIMRDNEKLEHTANNVILGKFLPAKATAAMQKLQANMTAFVDLFPPGTETGGETKAGPAIWAEMDAFRAMAAQMAADAKAAEAAVPGGQDAFGAAWQVVAADCNACHAKYTPTMMVR